MSDPDTESPAEPARLRADAERNRRKLVQAARELFAERGIDVTLDEVARHAGVGTGTAYRRFTNKDSLIEELMVERVREIVAIGEDCLAEPDPWLGLAGYFERALALQAADRGLKDVLFASGTRRERVVAERSRLGPIVTALVERAIDAGVVRPDLAQTDVAVINIMLNTLVDFGREVEPELYRRMLAVVLDGLRADGTRTDLPVPPLPLEKFVEAVSRWPK